MKFGLFLLLLTSCSFLEKKQQETEYFKVNQCLFRPGVRAMIVEVHYSKYKIFYKIQNSLYLAEESKPYVHARMIPVSCTQDLIDSMEKFIEAQAY